MGQRILYTWKSVSSLQEDFFLQDESSFESNPVTKLVVTQATTRHQMKYMDIIFPLIPFNFLWVKYFGYYSLSKSIIFTKSLKFQKLTSFAHQQQNSNVLSLFFNQLLFLEKSGQKHVTKAR